MKKLFLSLAACATILSASAGVTWKLGPYDYEADTLFHATTGPGMTTTGIRLSNPSNKTNIYYTTIDLTNPDLELRGVQAKDDGDLSENVNAMGVRKNGQGNGQYIAGVNGDFFNMGGKPIRTNGHSLVDGTLYNAANGGDFWNTWASYATVTGKKDIVIDQGVMAAKMFKFPNGQTHSFHVNGGRWENYLVIYTPDSLSTGTNIWGRECTMKLVSGNLATNDAVFEITSEVVGNCDGSQVGNMEVPRDGFVLSGVGDAYAMMAQLKVGDKVSLGTSVSYNGKEINPSQSIGGCSMIVMNGKIAPDSYFSANVIDHFTSNQARTVIGYNADRTKLIILVADKYTKYTANVTDEEKLSYGTSTGMVMQRMGHIMLALDCYTAMAFDGGGSSQLYNKELGIRNVPYGDTYLRPVANGFFAVSTTPVDNTVASIEVVQKNVKLNEGETFTPKVYGYNSYGVLVDKNVEGFTFTVAPALGSVEGTTFTAGAAANSTHAVVALGDIKCAVRILTNGGGDYVTSGDDNAPLQVAAPYESDEPLGVDKEPIFLTEQWHFVNPDINDGWDGTVPNWESENAIKAKACPRFATARNGRFYTVDMTTMSIAEIDPEGNMTPLYKLPSLEGREINGVPDYYGTAISSDDAGNFLVGHLFTKNDTYRIWTVYNPKTGKAKHFDIEIPAGETASGRIDNIGRVVGDLTRDAYVYVMPKATGAEASQKVLIIHFEGDGNVDNLTATPTMSKTVYMAGTGNTGSTAQPKYATVADMKDKDINDTFFWYSKAGGIGQYNQDLFCYENGQLSINYCTSWNNYSSLNGFDTFTFAGKRYFVVGYAEAGEKQNNQHIVIMDEQSNKIAEWNNPDYQSGAGYISITAVPVNANQVNIYLYNCTGSATVNGQTTGAIAGALLSLTFGGEYTAAEPVEITPSGLDFDSYADGTPFKLTATNANGAWSSPAGFYHTTNPDAFNKDGQLTAYLDRGSAQSFNTQDYVDNTMQKAFVVRKLNDHVGNVLAVTQPWSPAASRYGWDAAGYGSSQAQLSFYVRNEDIKENTTMRHYIRVRFVYSVLLRGCHYTLDQTNNNIRKLTNIYASHENNWVVPAGDADLGDRYAETGINFAQWEDETGRVEDIPAVPVVRYPNADEIDIWDPGHKPDAEDANGYPAYMLNDERYRVYEFDTYIDDPSKASISVQFNLLNRNLSYFIKEVKFFDLGTDEAAANLLGKRELGWRYYNSQTSGIEDIIVDEAIESSDAPAVYYNLQGVEIKNPSNGIYIVRRGNQVSKEFIR